MASTRELIIAEIYKAMEKLGADPELLATVASWGDTLPDEEILRLLIQWNRPSAKHSGNGSTKTQI